MREPTKSGQKSFTGTAMRQLLRRAKTCALSTVSHEDDTPYCSLANIATDGAGRPLLLISSLAWHTQNLEKDPRASVLVSELPSTGDALVGPRVTVLGRFEQAPDEGLRRRYLARHPQAGLYADFADFSFWQMEPSRVHGVAGFGRIETLSAEAVFVSSPDLDVLEASAIAHMNNDHLDAVQLYATRLLKAEPGDWRVVAIDPDGCDLGAGEQSLRLEFQEPVIGANALRLKFAELTRIARDS
jgi:heme iron utilization protein